MSLLLLYFLTWPPVPELQSQQPTGLKLTFLYVFQYRRYANLLWPEDRILTRGDLHWFWCRFLHWVCSYRWWRVVPSSSQVSFSLSVCKDLSQFFYSMKWVHMRHIRQRYKKGSFFAFSLVSQKKMTPGHFLFVWKLSTGKWIDTYHLVW